MHLTEEHIFEEFGLELEPDSARAIVTRLQQAGLEMEPSVNAQGVHEMTLRLPEEKLDQEDPGEKNVDEAAHSRNRTDIESATQTDASYPQTKVQEEQVNQAPVVARPVGPSRSREKRRRGVPRPHWRKMTWVLIVWSAFIVIWAISGTASNDCGSQASQAAKSGCEAGTGIGVALILFIGFFGFVFFSLIWFMTRPRGRDCPVCGERVKRGQTKCSNCGHDFAAAVAS